MLVKMLLFLKEMSLNLERNKIIINNYNYAIKFCEKLKVNTRFLKGGLNIRKKCSTSCKQMSVLFMERNGFKLKF